MPRRCRPYTKHRLEVTLSLSGTLTIEFPHEEWATAFSALLKGSAYHQDCMPRIRGHWNNHVRLDLLPEVTHIDRVQFIGQADYIIFKFGNERSAQVWCKGSGLWSSPEDRIDNSQLTLPLCWSHHDFDSCMGGSTTRRDTSAGSIDRMPPDIVGRSRRSGTDGRHWFLW